MQGQENVINSGDDIVLNNLKYDDAKTQINAKGYVTTENVTGEDLSAKGGSFPQSVSADIQPSCDPAPEVDPIYSDEDSFSGQIGQIGMQEPATIEKAGIEETVSEPGIVGVPIPTEGSVNHDSVSQIDFKNLTGNKGLNYDFNNVSQTFIDRKIDGSKIAEKLTNNDIKVTIEKVENEK